METTQLKIIGMAAGIRAEDIPQVLQRVSGVRTANFDLDSGIVTISHDADTLPALMIGALIAAGYEAQVTG